MNPVIGAVAFLMVLFGGFMGMCNFDDIVSEKFCAIIKVIALTMLITGFVLLIIGAATEG